MSHISDNSLNVQKGTTINELEAFFIIIDRLLENKISENPKSGMKIAKGEPNEVRMRYIEAQSVLKKLQNTYAAKGCFSLGICGTCSNFNNSWNSTGYYGKCLHSVNKLHVYDTCDQHSIDGGGFGL